MGVDIAELAKRAERAGLYDERRAGSVDLVVDGDRMVIQTGMRVVRRARVRVLAEGVAAMAAGCGMTLVSPWFAVAAAGGLAYSVLGPRRIKPVHLVTVDARAERVIGSNAVTLADIRSIHGAFETRGWDGFSVVSAQVADGGAVPLLLLLGADERLAEHVCTVLGALTGCPAEYTGTSGRAHTCFAPTA